MAKTVAKDDGVRDARGRFRGDPRYGGLDDGQASEVLRVAGPVDAMEAFEALTPRERGRVVAAWHRGSGGVVPD